MRSTNYERLFQLGFGQTHDKNESRNRIVSYGRRADTTLLEAVGIIRQNKSETVKESVPE